MQNTAQTRGAAAALKLKAIDLFSGCGGLTVGLKRAGFEVVGAVELDPVAVQAYRDNHPDVELWHDDIRKLSPTRLMRQLCLGKGELDVLAGCPPCQGFSTLRTRNGAKQNRDRNNKLAGEILRFAKAFKPRVVMMENVPGLKDRRAFSELIAGLDALGYTSHWQVRDAADFGVPQRRKRLILLAGLGFAVGFPRVSGSVTTVRQAIGKLPKAGRSGDPAHDLPENRSQKIARMIKAIPKNGGSRSALPKNHQLECHKKFSGFHDIYGRMAWDRAAPTITGGCHNPSKGRFLHPHENRAITIREAALLQSFPLRYRFPVAYGKEALALMIGNALPPEFIRRHAVAVTRTLRRRRLQFRMAQ